MNLCRVFLSLSFIVLTASCSSDGEERPDYLDSFTIKNLEIPPTLTRPNSSEELQIPEPTARALALLNQREQVEGSVAPIFKGIELQSDQGMYWLLIEKDADALWPVLRNFWANEGIEIERDEPLLGFMETEWVKEYQQTRDSAFYEKLFTSLSPDVLDKFRMRVERVKGQQQTRLYVSHRGREISVTDETSRWLRKQSDKALEKEILYRFVLFSGLSKENTEGIFSGYKAYQSRVHVIDGTSDYRITGQTDFVWRRLIHVLDRLGVEIKNKDKENGEINVLVSEIADQFVEQQENLKVYIDPEEESDETDSSEQDSSETDRHATKKSSGSSWLSAVFSTDEQKNEKGQVEVFITITAMDNSTRLQLALVEGKKIESGVSGRFRDGLVNLLK